MRSMSWRARSCDGIGSELLISAEDEWADGRLIPSVMGANIASLGCASLYKVLTHV
jgi:hypothetical protein